MLSMTFTRLKYNRTEMLAFDDVSVKGRPVENFNVKLDGHDVVDPIYEADAVAGWVQTMTEKSINPPAFGKISIEVS